MGYYINQDSKGKPLPSIGKAEALLNDGGTKTDNSFKENLICVVNNGFFEAAAYCYSEQEYKEFSDPADRRPKVWLVHPEAKKLSDYKG